MAFQYPLLQPRFILVERQIPVFSLPLDRLAAAQGGLGVYKLVRAEGTAAFFALVTVCPLRPAFRAGPDYIAVCKEGIRLGVIILLALLLDEFPFIIKLPEKLRGGLLMHIRSGPGIYVEIDSESGERILYYPVEPVHDILRCASLLFGLDGDRHPVLVGAADEKHILAFHPQISHINVGRHINPGKMADMHRSVCVRKRTCDKCPFVIVFHIL